MEGRFPFSPKFRKFRLEMERTSSVRSDWNIWEHLWSWSTLTGPVISVGPTELFLSILTKLFSLVPLFCIVLTRTITRRAVAWVGSVQTECTVPLGTWAPRQNVYACVRLSISGLFFSHTFQSDQSLPRALGFILCAACGSVVLLHAARVFDYFVVIEIAFMDNQHRSLKQLVD